MSPEIKKVQLQILKNNINIGGLLADELDLFLAPALKKVVEDTENVFDDLLLAAIYPTLEAELKKLIEKHINGLFDGEE